MRTIITTTAANRRAMDRAAAMTTFLWDPTTVPVTAVRATQIPTTTQRSSRRRQCSCSTKPRIRLRLSPWIPTISSTVIHRAYPRQRVPSCSQFTANKARPSSRPWTFRIPTMKSRRVLATVERIQLRQHQLHHRSENGLWILRARRTSCEPSTLWDLETSDSAKVNLEKYTKVFDLWIFRKSYVWFENIAGGFHQVKTFAFLPW